MSVWKGWQTDLLVAAKLPITGANLRFLTEWHNTARTDCKLNPIDLHQHEQGSTNCEHLHDAAVDAQAYKNEATASRAFARQIEATAFQHIRGALVSGNPYTVSNYTDVGSDLGKWGSGQFGTNYVKEIDSGGSGGPGPGVPGSADTLKGWKDFQASVNTRLPKALHASQRSRTAALHSLHRASKVGH